VNHNSYLDRPYVYGQIEHDGGGETTWNGQAIAAWDCGDARSALDQEYVDTYSGGSVYFSLGMLPHCTWLDGDFNSSGGSTNFSWSEVNGGFSQGNPNYPWGIVRTSLYVGLEQTRTNYNRAGSHSVRATALRAGMLVIQMPSSAAITCAEGLRT